MPKAKLSRYDQFGGLNALSQGGGAALSVDFVQGQTAGVTVTRASTARKINTDGSLSSVANDNARISADEVLNRACGLLVEEAVDNKFANPGFAGAVSGRVGSGGVIPTGWTSSVGSTGLAVDVTVDATGIEFQWSVASCGATTTVFLFGGSTGLNGIAAGAAEEWCSSAWIKQITRTNANNPGQRNFYYNSGGTFLSSSSFLAWPAMQTDKVYPLEHRRTTPANTAFIAPVVVAFDVTSGQAVDFKIRIERCQFEKRSFRGVYQPGLKAADVVTVDNAASLYGSAPWSVEVDFRAGRRTKTATIFEAKLDANNRVELRLNDGSLECVSVTSGSAVTTTIGKVPILMNSRVGLAVSPAGIIASLNGKTAKTASLTPPSGLTSAQLGGGTSGYINGFIGKLRAFRSALSATQIEADARTASLLYDDFDRADGAPGSAPTGQAWQRVPQGDTTATVLAVIASGKLTAPDSGAANTAAYTGFDAGAGVLPDIMAAQVQYAAGTTGGNTTLIQNPTGLGHVSEITTSPGAAHNSMTDATAQLGYFDGSATVDVSFGLPVASSKDGSTVYNEAVCYPDDSSAVWVAPTGDYVRSTNPGINSRRGRYLTWEHFWTGSGMSRPSFLAVGAEV